MPSGTLWCGGQRPRLRICNLNSSLSFGVLLSDLCLAVVGMWRQRRLKVGREGTGDPEINKKLRPWDVQLGQQGFLLAHACKPGP